MADSKRLPDQVEQTERRVVPAGSALIDLPPTLTRASRLVVGYSGGVDSTVLCHQLLALHSRLGDACPPIEALHVNHGLQPAAEKFESHCRDQAERWGLPLTVHRAQIAADEIRLLGPEAAARKARRQAFAHLASQRLGSWVVLAHHLNDQVETMLLQWLRGAGLEGLTSMQAMSPPRTLAAGDASAGEQMLAGRGRSYGVWRPLLAMSKKDLLDYAAQAELEWVEDPTNADLDLDRNRLRHEVMPTLEKIRSGSLSAMGRSIQHLQSARRMLEALSEQDLEACRFDGDERSDEDASGCPHGALRLDALLSLDDARQAACLRAWIRRADQPAAPSRRLEEFVRQLRSADGGSRAELTVRLDSLGETGGFQVRLRAGILRLGPLSPENSAES